MAIIIPVSGPVTQPFGCTGFSWEPAYTWHGDFCSHFHNGIDYGAPSGTPILAAANGYVRAAGNEISLAQGGGLSVWLQHNSSFHTVYSHCSQLLVSVGQQVVTGQVIARVGETGLATGPHLHFTVWTNTATWGFEYDDPNLYFVGGSQQNLSIAVIHNDIPTLEPISGTLIRGVCVRTPLGLYAPPTKATAIKYVYFDRLLANPVQYSLITNADGSIYIDPVADLDTNVEVLVEYVA